MRRLDGTYSSGRRLDGQDETAEFELQAQAPIQTEEQDDGTGHVVSLRYDKGTLTLDPQNRLTVIGGLEGIQLVKANRGCELSPTAEEADNAVYMNVLVDPSWIRIEPDQLSPPVAKNWLTVDLTTSDGLLLTGKTDGGQELSLRLDGKWLKFVDGKLTVDLKLSENAGDYLKLTDNELDVEDVEKASHFNNIVGSNYRSTYPEPHTVTSLLVGLHTNLATEVQRVDTLSATVTTLHLYIGPWNTLHTATDNITVAMKNVTSRLDALETAETNDREVVAGIGLELVPVADSKKSTMNVQMDPEWIKIDEDNRLTVDVELTGGLESTSKTDGGQSMKLVLDSKWLKIDDEKLSLDVAPFKDENGADKSGFEFVPNANGNGSTFRVRVDNDSLVTKTTGELEWNYGEYGLGTALIGPMPWTIPEWDKQPPFGRPTIMARVSFLARSNPCLGFSALGALKSDINFDRTKGPFRWEWTSTLPTIPWLPAEYQPTQRAELQLVLHDDETLKFDLLPNPDPSDAVLNPLISSIRGNYRLHPDPIPADSVGHHDLPIPAHDRTADYFTLENGEFKVKDISHASHFDKIVGSDWDETFGVATVRSKMSQVLGYVGQWAGGHPPPEEPTDAIPLESVTTIIGPWRLLHGAPTDDDQRTIASVVSGLRFDIGAWRGTYADKDVTQQMVSALEKASNAQSKADGADTKADEALAGVAEGVTWQIAADTWMFWASVAIGGTAVVAAGGAFAAGRANYKVNKLIEQDLAPKRWVRELLGLPEGTPYPTPAPPPDGKGGLEWEYDGNGNYAGTRELVLTDGTVLRGGWEDFADHIDSTHLKRVVQSLRVFASGTHWQRAPVEFSLLEVDVSDSDAPVWPLRRVLYVENADFQDLWTQTFSNFTDHGPLGPLRFVIHRIRPTREGDPDVDPEPPIPPKPEPKPKPPGDGEGDGGDQEEEEEEPRQQFDYGLTPLSEEPPRTPVFSLQVFALDAPSQVATKQYVDNAIAGREPEGDYPTTEQMNAALAGKTDTEELGELAYLDMLDYGGTRLVNKPTLGSLASLDSLSYTSGYLVDKPTLGALAALNVLDYSALSGKPVLGSLAALNDYSYNALTDKPTIETVLAGSGLTKTGSTLNVNAVQTFTDLTVTNTFAAPNVKALAGLDSLSYNDARLTDKPPLGALALLNSLSYTNPLLTNKPTLGVLAALDSLSYNSLTNLPVLVTSYMQLTDKPTLGQLSTLDTLDYAGGRILNLPDLTVYLTQAAWTAARNEMIVNIDTKADSATVDALDARVGTAETGLQNAFTGIDALNAGKADKTQLGALAPLNTLDYRTNLLIGKPHLGTLSTLDALDYESDALANKPTLGALSTRDTLDYADAALTNKPQLGALAALDLVDYDSMVINKPTLFTHYNELAGLPTLGALSPLDTLDYNSDLLINKPNPVGVMANQNLTLTDGHIIGLDPLDYTTGRIINKPTLGALAPLNALDYASALLTNKPTLGALATMSMLDYNSGFLFNKPTIETIAAGTGLTKTGTTLNVSAAQHITTLGVGAASSVNVAYGAKFGTATAGWTTLDPQGAADSGLAVWDNMEVQANLVGGNLRSKSWAVFDGGAAGDGTAGTGGLIFQRGVGEHKHWVRTRHATTPANNAMDFFVNSSADVYASNGPGTGNTRVLSLQGDGNASINNELSATRFANSGTGSGAPILNGTSTGTKYLIYPEASATTTNYAIGVEPGGTWWSTNGSHRLYWRTTPMYTMTQNLHSFVGTIDLSGITPLITYPTATAGQLGPPTNGTRSPGTRVVLNNTLGAALTDDAIGVDAGGITWIAGTGRVRLYYRTTRIVDVNSNGMDVYGVASATGAPTAGTHLCNKAYVDSQVNSPTQFRLYNYPSSFQQMHNYTGTLNGTTTIPVSYNVGFIISLSGTVALNVSTSGNQTTEYVPLAPKYVSGALATLNARNLYDGGTGQQTNSLHITVLDSRVQTSPYMVYAVVLA